MNKRDFLRSIGLGGIGLLTAGAMPDRFLSADRGGERRTKNWMWLRRKRGATTDSWKRLFATAKDSGIDAVLPEVYNGERAFYASRDRPRGELWLEDILPIARQEGLEFHAWMWMMPCNEEKVWKEYPEWYSVNRKGDPSWEKPAYVNHYRFLCPARPEVHDFLRSKVVEMAAMPGVAGIHLDYIRYPDVVLSRPLQKKYGITQDKEYPEYDYCYCTVCRDTFRALTGSDPLKLDDPASNAEWVQFRYDRVTTIVNEVLLPEIRKSDKLATAAVFPNWESVRQQWSEWDVDAVLPMLYHGFYDQNIDWIRERTSWGVNALKGRVDLYSGLFVGHLDVRELRLAVNAARQGGANGVCLFHGHSMTKEQWTTLKTELAVPFGG